MEFWSLLFVWVKSCKAVNTNNLGFALWLSSCRFCLMVEFNLEDLLPTRLPPLVSSCCIFSHDFAPEYQYIPNYGIRLITSQSTRTWQSCHLLCKKAHKSRHLQHASVWGVICNSGLRVIFRRYYEKFSGN